MVDPLTIAREHLGKARAKLLKLEKQLETARSDVADLETTVRVMAQITGESAGESSTTSANARQFDILQILPESERKALPPATLFEGHRMITSEAITLDTFRTTLWRMKGSIYVVADGDWVVRGEEGKYWKERYVQTNEASGTTPKASNSTGLADGSQGAASHHSPEGSIPSSSTPSQASDEPDWDDDVPF